MACKHLEGKMPLSVLVQLEHTRYFRILLFPGQSCFWTLPGLCCRTAKILALGPKVPVQLVLGRGSHLLHFLFFSPWSCTFCSGRSMQFSWWGLSGREERFGLSLTDKCRPPPAALFILTAASGSRVAKGASSLVLERSGCMSEWTLAPNS